ncbi:flagellar motor protein MotB [Vibrio coralliilyticus]|uniref:flagellar motor protein MotB n=1 Tax=Vibrio coralliilyticus TaxID=190893 RepID=UPI00148E313A|nr:flagellar motor protein MotB [Vibrio coralliilyticus]NOI30417.1 flagellar motor protein MotB [Vibrio coralliilyticus]NOI50005.1 flagellar motor protein MotB [Vibrio coralliilyticus]
MLLDDDKVTCPPPGAPKWLSTFADLMSLLMCFFVLLLSFSEMDVLKFKRIAGSMEYAFGVQHQVKVVDIPKGTSVIATEFRPGRPEPTPLNFIMQHTSELTKPHLDLQPGEERQGGGKGHEEAESNEANKALAAIIQAAFKREVDEGMVDVEDLGQELVIRIREKGMFPQGSAFLQPAFRPLIRQLADLIKDVPGQIRIAGHTSSMTFDSELYRSSWDLSALRAASVVLEMEKVPGFDSHRVAIQGWSEHKPLSSEQYPNSVGSSRRVEISLRQGEPTISDEVSVQDQEVGSPQ